MIIGGHHSLFSVFSRTLWCYCEIFLVLAKYKGILYKIMNGDPKLLFHILKVKY